MINWDQADNTAAPSWMGSGSYAKWTQSDPDYDQNDPQVKQNWWRSPQVGGGIVYHPYYGWQSRSEVRDYYNQNPNGVPWDQFQQAGFTNHPGEDWRAYFPGAQTDAELMGTSGSGGGSDNSNGTSMFLGGYASNPMGQNPQPSTPPGGGLGSLANGGFSNYPSQWGDASDVYSNFAYGGGTETPWQWDVGSDVNANLASGGPTATPWQWDAASAINAGRASEGPTANPWQWDLAGGVNADLATRGATDTPWQWDQASNVARDQSMSSPVSRAAAYEAAKKATQYDITDAISQAAEQAGLGNYAKSSMLGRQAQDITGKYMSQLASQWTQQELAAEESNRQNQMNAANSLFQYGQGQVGLDESARASAMNAANNLYQYGQGQTGLAEASKDRSMNAANNLFQYGQGNAGLAESSKDRNMAAANSLFQYGQGRSGLTEAAKDRAMNAAGGLTQLGGLLGQYPMSVAQQAWTMGSEAQKQDQAGLTKQYEDFLRSAAENNPYLQMIYSMATGQGQQQQYRPGAMSSILGVLGSVAGAAL